VTRSRRVRLGAVGYLNARPLVYGLDALPEFDVRYDLPSECARLLHAHDTDLGLIPSIEYLRGPGPYTLVPGAAIASKGPVASVAIYTRRDPRDIRSIALDTSSRTSIALATILLRREFGVAPRTASMPPDLDAMLAAADAALIIGDTALFLDHRSAISNLQSPISKLDLGELWTRSTGLPFVYAFWAGWPDAVTPEQAERLQRTRDEGVAHAADVARTSYPGDPARQEVARRYLRDNIRYFLGPEELEGLQTFYRYATELEIGAYDRTLRFYHAEHHSAR
jgi:chorismate dehydratase